MRKIVLLCLLLLGAVGCASTPLSFHERGRLVDPIMDLSDGAGETHFYQKSFYSREASVGGFGGSAGGGCGSF